MAGFFDSLEFVRQINQKTRLLYTRMISEQKEIYIVYSHERRSLDFERLNTFHRILTSRNIFPAIWTSREQIFQRQTDNKNNPRLLLLRLKSLEFFKVKVGRHFYTNKIYRHKQISVIEIIKTKARKSTKIFGFLRDKIVKCCSVF